ncbi:MAG: hypothetical protein WD845_18620 [Pirellulales bacterium]
MGRHHEDGYSASVEGFLVVRGHRFRLAKTNDRSLTLAVSCELPPGSEGELIVTIDGHRMSRLVTIPSGVALGQSTVNYTVAAPF